jgi:hypothetical protein
MMHNERILKVLQRIIEQRIIVQSDENYCSVTYNPIELNTTFFKIGVIVIHKHGTCLQTISITC